MYVTTYVDSYMAGPVEVSTMGYLHPNFVNFRLPSYCIFSVCILMKFLCHAYVYKSSRKQI